MDELIYTALNSYYHVLEKTGYISHDHTQKLLILIFLKDFVYQDYRGMLSAEDYRMVEKALNCLYGSTCLIPYPDYLKMGKLHLGEMTELAQRLKSIEEVKVLKLVSNISSDSLDSDVYVSEQESGDIDILPPTHTYSYLFYGNSATILSEGESIGRLSNAVNNTVEDIYNNTYYYIAVHSSKNLVSVINRGVENVTENFELKNNSLVINQDGTNQVYKLYECSINEGASSEDMYVFELTINIG